VFDVFAGLPLHSIVVHATVVAVPVTAVVVMLAALWPRFRRWAGLLPLVLSLLSVVLVPVSTQSGQALEERVAETALVEEHAGLGEMLLPWVIGMAVVAVALTWMWWAGRAAPAAAETDAAERSGGAARTRVVAVVVALGALVSCVGTTIQVIEIGHTGAEAVWSDKVN
jgi:ABC-type glucose/galactose transport system permease subunit